MMLIGTMGFYWKNSWIIEQTPLIHHVLFLNAMPNSANSLFRKFTMVFAIYYFIYLFSSSDFILYPHRLLYFLYKINYDGSLPSSLLWNILEHWDVWSLMIDLMVDGRVLILVLLCGVAPQYMSVIV